MSPSPRHGRRGLALVRDTLSERDWSVLRAVAAHRFLTTRHVEGFCFADHASPLSAARITRRVLNRLLDLHLLTHLDRRVGGVRAGSASYVWTLTPTGQRLLAGADDAFRCRVREPSVTFLDHTLAVADTHLMLHRAHRAGQLELLEVTTEPDCWRRYTGPSGAPETLRPDLFAVTAVTDYEDSWFIEVDRGTESLPRLLAKCGQYERYRRMGLEQHQRGVFPLVVWLMPSAARTERLVAALARKSAAESGLFRVSTADRLVPLLAGGPA
jgi:hypothetical protein